MTDAEVNGLEPHPLAVLFDRDNEGLPALAASLAVEGMREEVVLLGNQVVDGNRRVEAYRLAVAQGHRPPGGFRWRFFNPKTDGDVWDFVLCKAVQRRGPPRGKAAEPILREELKRNHSKSDRSIQMRTGIHYSHVAALREHMEAAGEIPRHASRTDARGSVRGAHRDKPPPDAGDSWEVPKKGSAEEKSDRAAREASKKTFDLLGQELPSHLRDAFGDDFYEDCATSLAWMAKHLDGNHEGYVRLHTKPANKTFAAMLREWAEIAGVVLEHHKPHCVCPDCGGRRGGCPTCFCTGWLSKGQYEERQSGRKKSNTL